MVDYMKILSYLLSLTIYIYTFCRHYLLNYYPILTHPVNFPCGRKPENPEKTHDFRQSVDELFPRAIRCSIQGLNLQYDLSGGSYCTYKNIIHFSVS